MFYNIFDIYCLIVSHIIKINDDENMISVDLLDLHIQLIFCYKTNQLLLICTFYYWF